ncbi:hypothetical protein RRG08_059880 [Elysia crispata]|uniref:Uncharacterized protein n=1 Tax=Elysia crispata TaxID=231223 RepID=A0AAE0ZHF5_9GAST|nr:hypothetical protein RRG08_059880 [Elysia crispata]
MSLGREILVFSFLLNKFCVNNDEAFLSPSCPRNKTSFIPKMRYASKSVEAGRDGLIRDLRSEQAPHCLPRLPRTVISSQTPRART